MNIFGTDPKKLYRTDGPATSKEAAYSVNTSKMEQIVLDAIIKFGELGCISDDVKDALPEYGYSVTCRYKALKDKGLIKVDNRTRKGKSGRQQQVMWVTNLYIPEKTML